MASAPARDNRSMNVLRSVLRRPIRWSGIVLPALLLVALASCASDGATYPQSTLHPHGDFAAMGDQLFMTTFWWALGVFILFAALVMAPMLVCA